MTQAIGMDQVRHPKIIGITGGRCMARGSAPQLRLRNGEDRFADWTGREAAQIDHGFLSGTGGVYRSSSIGSPPRAGRYSARRRQQANLVGADRDRSRAIVAGNYGVSAVRPWSVSTRHNQPRQAAAWQYRPASNAS